MNRPELEEMKRTFEVAAIDLATTTKTAKSEDVEDINYIIGMCALTAKLIGDLLSGQEDAAGDEFEQFIKDSMVFRSALAQHGFGVAQ